MTETQRLIRELKKQLKGHSIQYQDIAAALGLSEGSVKRLLAEAMLDNTALKDLLSKKW